MRRLLVVLSLATLFALPAGAQHRDEDAPSSSPANPVTMGKGPKDGDLVPAWIFYWLLGGSTVVCGSLVLALRTLWKTLREERLAKIAPGLTADERGWLRDLHETVTAKDEDGVFRLYTPRLLYADVQKITTISQEMLDTLELLGDSREDRLALRTAFESERNSMRLTAHEEIKGLQARLFEEQEARRKDAQGLWEKNDSTTREVMNVIRDMIVALDNASRVISQWHEANPSRGA